MSSIVGRLIFAGTVVGGLAVMVMRKIREGK